MQKAGLLTCITLLGLAVALSTLYHRTPVVATQTAPARTLSVAGADSSKDQPAPPTKPLSLVKHTAETAPAGGTPHESGEKTSPNRPLPPPVAPSKSAPERPQSDTRDALLHEIHPEAIAALPAGIPAEPVTELPKTDKDPHFPIYSSGPNHSNMVALTFDDGPHPVFTPRVLDELRKRNVKATFFLLGDLVRRYPWVVRQIMAEGHEIGNHTYDHRLLTAMTNELIEKEITETQNQIKNITGSEPTLFRPPYGVFRPDTKAIFREHNLNVVLWSVDPRDWRIRNQERITQIVTKQTRGGSIVLCHDIHKTTLDALPQILDTLQAEGYEFATVSQMCGICAPLNVAAAK